MTSFEMHALVERLMRHAMNEEMVDAGYTEHGKDLLAVCTLLKEIARQTTKQHSKLRQGES